jgi:chemotaxis protein MotB
MRGCMKSRVYQERDAQTGRWILTFNDLITLLLTFFVLLLAMSQVDAGKMRAISIAVRESFGIPVAVQGTSDFFEPFVFRLQDRDIEDEKAKKIASQSLGSEDGRGMTSGEKAVLVRSFSKLEGMDVKDVPGGVSVSTAASSYFSAGSEEFHPRGRGLLAAISDILQAGNAEVRVESSAGEAGRHGNLRGRKGELSLVRAVNVAEYLISRNIAPERISVIGDGDVPASVPHHNQGSTMMHDNITFIISQQKK